MSKEEKHISLLIALVFLVLGVSSAKEINKTIIGPVQGNEGKEADAGGCRFSEESNRDNVFVTTDMENAWVNIDDQNVKVKKSGTNHWPDKKKIKSSLKFEANNVQIILKVEIISKGEAGAYYEGEMEALVHGRQQIVKVSGGCGC